MKRLRAFLSGVMADAITELLAPVKGIEGLLRRRRERVAYRKSYEAWRVIVTRQLRLPPLAVIQEGDPEQVDIRIMDIQIMYG